MRRLIPLIAATAALGAAVPATAEAADTKVNRHGEAVGFLVHQGASRFNVQDHDYYTQAEVRRQGNRRFNFYNARGALFAFVRKATGNRWDVMLPEHDVPVGHVEKRSKNRWMAYEDEGESVGDATGPAALQGAAAVIVVFD